MNGQGQVLEVNWCEVSVLREDTGEELYHNAWITDYELNEGNIRGIEQAGRARWKVENQHNNVLKTKGYHLCYRLFENWDKVLDFMYRGLELDSS